MTPPKYDLVPLSIIIGGRRRFCQACRVKSGGERAGFESKPTTIVSGTAEGAGARRRAKSDALLAEPWLLDLSARLAGAQLPDHVRLHERPGADHRLLHELHHPAEYRQCEGHHRPVQLDPG